jgi:ABC-type multidrug transport system fused ATPase/permease subunit
MLVNFFYNYPIWLVGAVMLAVIVGLSLLGLTITHRLLPQSFRKEHNEFTGFMIAVVSVFYAVLLAFIAVAVWESFGKAQEIVSHEASLVDDIFNDATTMPEPLRTGIPMDLGNYLKVVLDEEWPAMKAGIPFGENGWTPLRRVHTSLSRFHTDDLVHAAMFSEILQRLNTLYDARRARLQATNEHLQPAIWGVVIAGLALTIAFTYLFGMSSFRMHMLMTAAAAAAIGLTVVLIIAFDYPFRGEVQVGSEPFEKVSGHIEKMLHEAHSP